MTKINHLSTIWKLINKNERKNPIIGKTKAKSKEDRVNKWNEYFNKLLGNNQ